MHSTQMDDKSNVIGWVSLAAVGLGVVTVLLAISEEQPGYLFAFAACQVIAIVTGLIARKSGQGKAGAILGGSFVVLSVLVSGFFMSSPMPDDGPTVIRASTP